MSRYRRFWIDSVIYTVFVAIQQCSSSESTLTYDFEAYFGEGIGKRRLRMGEDRGLVNSYQFSTALVF